jgi:hypothetical protein
MSLRDDLNASTNVLPPPLDEVVSNLPPFLNRRRAAEEISKRLFPVSHRSLENWALPTRRCNGHAIVATRALFEIAYAKFASAPVVMGGRRTRGEQRAA